jgi:alpha-galactosidase
MPHPSVSSIVSRNQACQAMAEDWCQSLIEPSGANVLVKCLRQGWGELQFGCSISGSPLRIDGQEYSYGLGTHADSEIVIRAEEGLVRFGAVVGLNQNSGTASAETLRLLFSIEVKGQEIWRSQEINLKSAGSMVDLTLPPGTKEILLKAWSVDGTLHLAHADWAAAWVELGNGERKKLGSTNYPSIPFSFLYDGKASSELVPAWPKTTSSRPGRRAGVVEHSVVWKDPVTQLECRLEISQFTDFPALEWVLHFHNAGKSDTPILENIQALNVTWDIRATAFLEDLGARLYRSRGSTVRTSDFEYQEEKLFVHEKVEMIAGGGRSSQNWLPFFNTDLGDKGVFTAIGWSGQWASSFEHVAQGVLQVRAGMEKTHLRLHPGEEIRSPRILQLFWKEDRIQGHNVLRKFLLEQHTPRIDNKPITGPFAIGHWGGMTTQAHLDRIAIYQREKLPQEYLWVDAGWYGLNSSYSPDEFLGDWGKHTGDWRVNAKAHPAGLKPIVEAAKAAGMKFMLWVEPERAIRGTHWPEEHPDWFLGEKETLLLNLGKPEALQGCIELLAKLIEENEVKLYREDFNMGPLEYWRANDTPDRQGITEIRFTEGLYQLWDTLLERYPDLIIDNCASGGRRIDLETIGRSIALWRSDLQCFPDYSCAGTQANGMGLSYWLPLHGTGTWASMPNKEACSTYRVRSTMGPAFQLSSFTRQTYEIQEDYPWDWFRKMGAEYLRARPFFIGDYYPLTESINAGEQHWAVYQMHRPDLGGGFIMAFRRKQAPWEKGVFRLHGLEIHDHYQIEDVDANKSAIRTGSDLTKGLEIVLDQPESSALLFYQKK